MVHRQYENLLLRDLPDGGVPSRRQACSDARGRPLNHADDGCEVSFSPDGFVFSTNHAYHPGQEIYVSYGKHSNDFLLAEYGFLLAENRWDEVCLDDVILPKMDMTQMAQLEERGFLGHYMLDTEHLGCHRTQVALRLLCRAQGQWHKFVDTGDAADDVDSQPAVDVLLMELLNGFLEVIDKTLGDIGKVQVDQQAQRTMLEQRWKQIARMVEHAVLRLRSRTVS